jgi:aspartyl-tRNA(Asn)/glutamyl-tRNA(Gln) amidotransferase subunit B
LRSKEYAFDYRYFPEPDLVPFEPAADDIERLRSSLPESPARRRARFEAQFGLGAHDVALLTASSAAADWFERAARAYGGDAKKVANWVTADLFGLLNEAGRELHDTRFPPEDLAALVRLVDGGTISGKQAKAVLQEMFATGGSPEAIAAQKGLQQISDADALGAVVDEVVAANPEVADKVRGGQTNAVGFLVGQVMKKTRGQANPGLVNELLRGRLSR